MEGKCRNVYQQIRRREYGIKKRPRSKFEILKTLVLDENYVYKESWTKYSSKDIKTEGGRIYFENYTKCYGGYGRGSKPVHLYSMSTPWDQKIETALVASIQPEKLFLPHKGERPSFFCIVSKCWLMRFDLVKGQLLEEVYLLPRSHCHFSDLSWNEPGSSIVLRSIHKVTGCRRLVEDDHPNVVKVLALFDVFPIKFTGMFEVTKSVFGKDTVDAMASSGFLTTMHRSGMVKLHSMEHILQKCKLYEAELYTRLPGQEEICGKQPCGLPLNITIKEEPPVLFQVQCHQNSLEVGGCPWHYMYTPPRKEGSFHVKSLLSGQLAKNGVLKSEQLGLDADRALFCTDESGRILHIDSNSVSVLRIKEANSAKSVIEKCFTINLEKENKATVTSTDTYTSSGRHVRRISFGSMLHMDLELPNLFIHNVDYEDELDLLWTSVDYSIEDDKMESYLRFHNNNTGETIKEMKLAQPFEESMHDENEVKVDLDTVVQTVKSFNGEFACVVYRLQAREEEQEQDMDQSWRRKGTKVQNNQPTQSEDSHTDSQRSSRSRQSQRQRRSREGEADEEWTVPSSSSDTQHTRRRKRSVTTEKSSTSQQTARQRSRKRTKE